MRIVEPVFGTLRHNRGLARGTLRGRTDVDAAADRIEATGAALLHEPADHPWGVRMLQCLDPDSFKLGVSTPLAG